MISPPNPSSRPTISAFVICCNEEKHIRNCLSALTWCDEIILVDSGSTDNTLQIAKEFNPKIIHHDWPGHSAQKRFALEQCSSEWVLNVDADEVITPGLKDEILSTIAAKEEFDGYEILRTVYHLKRFWRLGGWYPEYRLRLCRRTATTWGGRDPHEHATVTGPTARLSGEMLHFTYDDLADQIRTLNSFSSRSAEMLWEDGKRASILKIVGNPIARFFKFYLVRGGYKEGFRGFAVAIIEAFYVFIKYLKLWEKELENRD